MQLKDITPGYYWAKSLYRYNPDPEKTKRPLPGEVVFVTVTGTAPFLNVLMYNTDLRLKPDLLAFLERVEKPKDP